MNNSKLQKKILHITEPFSAGVFTAISDLAKGLPQYKHIVAHGLDRIQQNISPDFLAEVTLIPWKFAKASLNPFKDILALYLLLQIITKTKPDIIHLHSSKAGFLGRLASFLLGYTQKTIYTPHGISFLRKDISPTKTAFFQYLENFAFRYFGGKIIACSVSEQKEIQKAQITCIYIANGVSISKIHPIQTTTKNQPFLIGNMGGIRHPQKGVTVFNRIAEHFIGRPIHFVWIGDGKDRSLLTANNIRITGWLKAEDLAEEIQQVDLYLSTSLWEGLSYSVLEAMAAHKPILLSNCIGNKDVWTDPEKESFDNTKQAIERIEEWLKNASLLPVYGAQSFEKIKNNFSLDQYLIKYENEYKNAAER